MQTRVSFPCTRPDLVSVAGDLLPFFDFLSVIVAGYVSTYVYAHMVPAGYGPGFWEEYRKDILIVAVLAAPVLRDSRFGSLIGNGATSGLLRRFTKRFVSFTGEVWQLAAEEYMRLKRGAEAADKAVEAAKGRLAGLATHTSESGAGATVTRFWRAGNVDFKRVPIPAGTDLERYRSAPREEIRVSVQR